MEDSIKASAHARMAELLSVPDQLDSVNNLRIKLTQKKSLLEAQLKTQIRTNLEEATAALTILTDSFGEISEIRKDFLSIDTLCCNTQQLVEEYPLIRDINTIRVNLMSTKRSVDRHLEIPEKVLLIKKLMADDNNILKTHVELLLLERTRYIACYQARKSPQELQVLEKDFREIDVLRQELEGKLWSLLADTVSLSQKRPHILVKILQVIEREEANDRQAITQSKKVPDSLQIPMRGYLGNSFEVLQNSIVERFRVVWDYCEGNIDILIEEGKYLVQDLQIVTSNVAQCFPSSYDIVSFYLREYHRQFHTILSSFSKRADQLTAHQIISLLKWVVKFYEKQLLKLGVSKPQPPLVSVLESLMESYRLHIRNLMSEWIQRIIQVDKEQVPDFIDSRYYTDAPVNLFKFINQQLDIAKETGFIKFIFEVTKECIEALLSYQIYMINMLENEWQDGLEYDYILAVASNNIKCAEFLSEFEGVAKGVLPIEPYLSSFENSISPVYEGFKNLSDKVYETIISYIFRDIEVALCKFFTKEWLQEDLMEKVVDTFDDYFENEIIGFIPEADFRRLATICLERVSKRYVYDLVSSKFQIDKNAIKQLAIDESLLRKCFLDYLREKVVQVSMQSMSDVIALLQSEPANIPATFEVMFGRSPGVTKQTASLILSLRGDLDKQQLRTAVEACRQIIDSKPVEYDYE